MIPPWIYAAVVALCLAIGAATGAHYQHEYDVAQVNKEKLAEAKAKEAERQRTDQVTSQIASKTALRQHEIQQQNDAIYIEVPKYVEKTVTRTEYVHAVRMLNDAAATGIPVPDTAGPADDAADDAETVAETITENIGQCRADLERFAELQQWIKGVSR